MQDNQNPIDRFAKERWFIFKLFKKFLSDIKISRTVMLS